MDAPQLPADLMGQALPNTSPANLETATSPQASATLANQVPDINHRDPDFATEIALYLSRQSDAVAPMDVERGEVLLETSNARSPDATVSPTQPLTVASASPLPNSRARQTPPTSVGSTPPSVEPREGRAHGESEELAAPHDTTNESYPANPFLFLPPQKAQYGLVSSAAASQFAHSRPSNDATTNDSRSSPFPSLPPSQPLASTSNLTSSSSPVGPLSSPGIRSTASNSEGLETIASDVSSSLPPAQPSSAQPNVESKERRRSSGRNLDSNSQGSTSPVSKKRTRASDAASTSVSPPKALTNESAEQDPPRYTTIRSEGSKEKPHVFKIKAGVTDGVRSKWPQGEQLKKFGKVPANEGKHLAFLLTLGGQLADNFNLRKGKGKDTEHWILDSLPEDYIYLIQKRGGGSTHVDHYIFGSPISKFRTANELFPHLQWLLLHGPNTSSSELCRCQYCSKKKKQQRVINADVGIDSPRARAPKKPRISESRATTTKKPQPTQVVKAKPPKRKNNSAGKPTYAGTYTNPLRLIDLSEGALFRLGEMVWVELPTPLFDSNSDYNITYWPAIIMERNVHQQSDVLHPGKLAKVMSEKVDLESVAVEHEAPSAPPTFSRQQTWKYRVNLVALSDQISRTESQMKPWLGHEPLLSTEDFSITAPESVKLVYDNHQVVRPSLGQLKTFHLAATTFALALQISAHVITTFSVVDGYRLEGNHIILPPTLTATELSERYEQLQHMHFHFFWWGGEKIWSGELVRLVADDSVVRLGEHTPGAENRGRFLKIAGIYKSEKGEAVIWVTGTLYELVEKEVDGGVAVAESSSAADSTKEDTTPAFQKVVAEDPFMPEAPPGLAFHRITPPGEAIHLQIEHVAGRYYQLPPSLQAEGEVERVMETLTPILEVVEAALTQEGEDEGEVFLEEDQRAVILAGLVPAYVGYMKCEDLQALCNNIWEWSDKLYSTHSAGGQDSQILLSPNHPSAPLSALLSTRYLLKTADLTPVYIQVQTRGWRTGPKEVLQKLSDAAKEGSGVEVPSPEEYKFRLGIEFTNSQLHQGNSPTPQHLHTIAALPTPRSALAFATSTKTSWRPDWYSINTKVMETALYLKFTQHENLKMLLLETGTRELVEDSPRDEFWGIGKKGEGRNELGKALGRVRERLVEEGEVVVNAGAEMEAKPGKGYEETFPSLG
ncbi:hypothetical protein P7C70_g5997, partial [Phenoliferia sp. Uapishka_3]